MSLPRPLPRFRRRRGAALIIVLAFAVLLTGVIIAFFSRAITGRQISNSSANAARAEMIARAATDNLIADFKQEIMLSSTVVPVGSQTLYLPSPAASMPNLSMVPIRSGNPPLVSGSDPIPNLIRLSPARVVSSAPLSISGPATAEVSGSGGSVAPSINGRYVSPARWNSHYLIPRKNPGAGTDSTPVSAFTAPDWVYVTRGGPALLNSGSNFLGSGTLAINNPVVSNTNYVIGRYAYAIYDEGGLLDLNVAGHPSQLTPSQFSYKSGAALADLTQIGLNQSAIDSIVGWRNYASSSVSGTFGGYSFTSAAATAWLNQFVLSNTTGYLRVTGSTYNGLSDQAFVSRQQLIQLFSSLNLSPDSLQYVGTFSRALEQPSYVLPQRDPSSPYTIVGSNLPPSNSSATSYEGNNTYWHGENIINLTGTGFLSVRVQNSFTRLDGSLAVVGEPLLKRRFALSRLQLVTTSATASQSSSDPIYQRFGLYRSSNTSPWTYNHGGSHILTMNEVAALNPGREPDFAELLKAAINAGSLGKAGPSGTGGNYQYALDISGDIQILQIMADLIDQTKSDNYPTWITWNSRNIYGIQDLPYFYRWHYFSVMTQAPNPLLSAADTVSLSNLTINHAKALGAGTFHPGLASYLIIPQIWNPHDANTPLASKGGPTKFRVIAETNAPDAGGGMGWGITAQPTDNNGFFDGVQWPQGQYGTSTVANPPTAASSAPKVLSSANAWLEFSDTSGGRAFREPTLLWRNGYPSGVTLSGSTRTEDASLSGNTYYGIVVGDTPVSWSNSVNGTNYLFQTSTIHRGPTNPGTDPSANDNITFRMQYWDNNSGSWITYQDAYVESNQRNIPGHTLFVNPAEYSGATQNLYLNPLMKGVNASGPALTAPMGGPYDPRSNRFATCITGNFDKDDPTLNGNPTLDAMTLVGNNPPSAAQNLAVGSSNFVLMATQRPSTSRGQFYYYTTPCMGPYNAQMRWYSSTNWVAWYAGSSSDASFYDGLLSQNNPAVKILGQNNSTQQQEYYEDPDGICRRAMGAYVPVSGAPLGCKTNTSTLIGLPMATSGNSFSNGIVTPSTQSQSRPIVLHRPFRNVAELGYAFRGTPWKNIDFFTPESGDTGLLDVFCINEPPSDALVAGKVTLNTRQAPVLKAVLAGAYRDELSTNSLPALSNSEAGNIANLLVSITSGTQSWRGPLTNVGDLVGHYVSSPSGLSGTDFYQYTSPANGKTYTYAGLSAALSGTSAAQDGSDVWSSNSVSSRNIQRFRESAIRPLVDSGQTRVWNLLLDVIAQSGRYPTNLGPTPASNYSKFFVEAEKRFWVHVAIDRFTGEVIDRQIEIVTDK